MKDFVVPLTETDIFGFGCQGKEGLTAIFVEFPKEFNVLET